ncbi:MAG: methyltransferase domain-containing protein [Alcanivorax sp.]|nr:methyltransferase domain-containing protein [Alcanivorax sp.]
MSFRSPPADLCERFDVWLNCEPGEALLREERDMLCDWLPRQVGQRAVEISCGQGRELLEGCPLPWRTTITQPQFAGGKLHSRLDCLPLAKASVDVMLLHHCLEFRGQPHQVLREAARCVAPGGTLAIVGFHPLSAMGLSRWLHWRQRPAWSGRFFTPDRITDWLQVLGFEVDGMASGFYTMPLSAPARRRLRVLEWLGGTFWPRHGGCYLLVSRKRAGLVRPLASSQRSQRPATVIPVPVARWRNDPKGQ